jgi:polyferredoxin
VTSIFSRLLERPPLTPARVRWAYATAITTDLLQLSLGPFGWAFADQALDVAAMVLISRALGFHPALLPTFALEFLPFTDMLPTWTGCVAIVVALRRRQELATTPPAPGPVIDI